MKIDKISLLLALIISITLTLLLLSTYEHTENGVTQKGLGWYMIEDLLEESHETFLFYTVTFLTVLFCIELIVSYFVIYKLKVWGKSKK